MKESKRGRKPAGSRCRRSAAAAPPGTRRNRTSAQNDPAQTAVRIDVLPEHAGVRLDQFLVSRLPEVSRVRVQQLLEQRKILLNGSSAKPSLKLKGGEHIEVVGQVQPAPLRAVAEDIPLDVVYEDRDLAVINKPAGMLVHAGAGTGDDPRNRGTLVNALLLPLRERFQRRGAICVRESCTGSTRTPAACSSWPRMTLPTAN